MSKNQYIKPEEFNKLVDQDKLIRMGYRISNTMDLKYAQKVIDALRPINAKDPGFKYSCECTKCETLWLFGYTIENIRYEADAKCKEMIELNRIERGESCDGVSSFGYPDGGTACSCPFDP